MTTPEEPTIDDELDPEDVQEIPPKDENLNDQKLVDLDGLVISLTSQIEALNTKLQKLDDRIQGKLIRLGKAKERLRFHEKKEIQKKRRKLEKAAGNG